MTLTELESVIAAAAPIFRKYTPNPTIAFSSGPAPLNLQDFLLSTMSAEDRKKLLELGWKTNGKIAWFYEGDHPADAAASAAAVPGAHRTWHL
ncbi:hypothetical protein [Noviherbaspirillum pedocola]|uniref:Uncharacterized protein n=1 Tax=Noviherbaspirillum pedocola TaxID=2801341 RepID=A0A934SZY4_9BURK|nr:hypothetical protein [Noviherbaspirillum pedocola]MBK4736157.1 hypothetical protein [Noviherbaspirillum pedocola]